MLYLGIVTIQQWLIFHFVAPAIKGLQTIIRY